MQENQQEIQEKEKELRKEKFKQYALVGGICLGAGALTAGAYMLGRKNSYAEFNIMLKTMFLKDPTLEKRFFEVYNATKEALVNINKKF